MMELKTLIFVHSGMNFDLHFIIFLSAAKGGNKAA